MDRFCECFEAVGDPRAANVRHDLIEVLFVALAAMVCGAESCVDMALFGEAKEPLLRRILRLEHGVPSHDTFSRLFRLLEPSAFEAAFGRFMEDFAAASQGASQGTEVVALDGKTARRSFDRAAGASPLHLVSAWAAERRMVLGQRAVVPGVNENQAVLELPGLLSLEGRIVTADAMHCQHRIAEATVARGGDYVLALKANQPGLLEDTRLLLDDPQAPPDDWAETVDGDHGRIETRRASVLGDLGYLRESHGFPGLSAVAKIEATREIDGRATTTTRYFITSTTLGAEQILGVVRAYWTIENSLHWVLDVVMDEDRARNRKDNGPENLALLRRFALSRLRANQDKGSIRRKIKKAGGKPRTEAARIGGMDRQTLRGA